MAYLFMIIVLLAAFFYVKKLVAGRSLLISFGLFFLVEIVWLFLSIVYIEGGTHIGEQARDSYFTGAAFRLFLIYVPFLLVLPIFTRKARQKEDCDNKCLQVCKLKKSTLHLVLQGALIGVILYGMLDMVIAGVPLLSKTITRSNYFASYSKLPLAGKVTGEITFFLMFINGKIFFDTKDKKKKILSVAILGLSIIHRVLMEYKYDGLYQVVFMFFLYGLFKWVATADTKKIFSIKTLIISTVIITIFLGVCLISYSITRSDNAFKMLMTRLFSLQAHTWWGEDLMHIENKHYWFNWTQVVEEVKAIFTYSGVYDKNTGIVNVMYHVAHPDTVNTYLSQNLRFYGNFVTVSINCFGYLGTAVYGVLIAKLIAYLIGSFYGAIKREEYIIMFLSLSLFLDLFEYFRVGNFCYLLNTKTVIVFLILLFFKKIKKAKFNKKIEAKNIFNPATLSVIIVSYKNVQILRDCLDSIKKYNDIGDRLEVIVSDNSEDNLLYDTIKAEYDWIKIIKNENKGFGAGNNRGYEISTGDYLLFLNPDTILIEPIFDFAIKKFEENKNLGLFGVKLIDKEFNNVPSFFLIDKYDVINVLFFKLCRQFEIFNNNCFIAGADLFVRRDSFEQAGLFDENIFMYKEEADLIKRIKNNAWANEISYFRKKRIIHLEGGTEEKDSETRLRLVSRIVQTEKYYCDKWNMSLMKTLKEKRRYEKFKFFVLKVLRKTDKVQGQQKIVDYYNEEIKNIK